MDDLADSIYAANSDTSETTPSLVDSLVARAISLNKREDVSPYSIYQLHLRKGEIWLGNRPIQETKNNLYWLTEYPERLMDATVIAFWKTLKRQLPTLGRDVIQVSDNLFWDRLSGELKTKEQLGLV